MREERKHIYLIGPCRLQNELMASYIEGHAEVECSVTGLPARIRHLVRAKDVEKRLLLCDCRGHCPENLAETIPWVPGKVPEGTFVALFNLCTDRDVEKTGLDLGACGFFYQDDGPDILIKGIEAIFQGDFWASRKLVAEYLSHTDKGKAMFQAKRKELTGRELEILGLLVSGASNKGIAETFCISPHTVKTHLYRIFKKIKVKNRLQAVQWASGRLF